MCHNCYIIPKRILEKLEKEKKVKLVTKDLSENFRKKRDAALQRGRRFDSLLPGNGDRLVYDSGHSESQRVKLVRKEGQPSTHDSDVNDAYNHAGVIRKYFRDQFHWNSIDNHGMDEIFNVHLSVNYNNAFWDGDEMSFGDGDGIHFTGFARAIDVLAHELTHGVVQYTAGLEYEGQPGALNEHYADVFGSVIKQYHKRQDEVSADWLIGDDIMGPDLKGRAIRSMKDPGNTSVPLDPQPANMSEYYNGEDDNHGVHINSGIPNKAFYLVAMAIGTFSAGKLWFEALKKLHPKAQFTDLYLALLKSIPKLISTDDLPPSAFQALNHAFSAVGIVSVSREMAY